MTILEERYAQLRGDVEELRIKHEEDKSELDKSIALWHKSMKDEQENPSQQNHYTNAKMAMDVTEKQINSLRGQIDILKRISQEMSIELEEKLNVVDRYRIHQLELLNKFFVKTTKEKFNPSNPDDLDLLRNTKYYGSTISDLGKQIDDVISTALKYFIRTLEYLDPERKFNSLGNS